VGVLLELVVVTIVDDREKALLFEGTDDPYV